MENKICQSSIQENCYNVFYVDLRQFFPTEIEFSIAQYVFRVNNKYVKTKYS